MARPSLSPQSSSKSKLKIPLVKKDRDGDSEASDEVVPELRRYLADEIALHHALAHKWLGVDAGENGGHALVPEGYLELVQADEDGGGAESDVSIS